MLAGIQGIRDAVAEFKIKRFKDFVLEKVTLYHPETVHWLVADGEFDPGKTSCEFIQCHYPSSNNTTSSLQAIVAQKLRNV